MKHIKNNRRYGCVFGAVLFCLVCFYTVGIVTGRISGEGIFYKSYLNQFGLDGYISHNGWDSVSLKPMKKETQHDLCLRLNISQDDPLCDPDNLVYDPDFFPYINDDLKPKNQEWATYDEVQQILGPYVAASCSTYEPKTIFKPKMARLCTYSLSGQKITVFRIRFDESTGIMYEISSINDKDFQ